MIVHDIDEEENLENERENPSAVETQQDPSPISPVPSRTRKAKETQTRLGVGRPLAVGGQGPRAVTKSSSRPRGKSSKSHKPKEPTIQEGESSTLAIVLLTEIKFIRIRSSECSNKRLVYILHLRVFTSCILLQVVETVDQGDREPQNDEHLSPTSVLDVSSIVESAVSNAHFKFPISSKSKHNIRIGPTFARPSEGFKVRARANASYEG